VVESPAVAEHAFLISRIQVSVFVVAELLIANTSVGIQLGIAARMFPEIGMCRLDKAQVAWRK